MANYSGYAMSRYDRGDDNSTMANMCIQYTIPSFGIQTRTYQPAIAIANDSSLTFYLNRTIGSGGQDGYENSVSSGYVMEIAQ
jgi:hypothetical protein